MRLEDLLVPDDLAAAFDRHPDAREHWDSFPCVRPKKILWWMVQARRPATRSQRTEETARRAHPGQRAIAEGDGTGHSSAEPARQDPSSRRVHLRTQP